MTVAVSPGQARSNILVVTGTDTGIGKTWVACALARALVAKGLRVVALKLVETGYDAVEPGEEDGAMLARATGQADPRQALARLRAPLAPAPAADAEGLALDFDDMLMKVEGIAGNTDVTIVEGSGGLLSPIGWDWHLVEMAQALTATALVVGADRLGVLNHVQLTLSALEIGGVPVAAVVLNEPERHDGSTGTNAAAIARLAGIEAIYRMPRGGDPASATEAMAGLAAYLKER